MRHLWLLARWGSDEDWIRRVWGEAISNELKLALIDRYHAWELIELLDIPIEDIVEIFEDEIRNNEDLILDELGLNNNDNNEDDEEYDTD